MSTHHGKRRVIAGVVRLEAYIAAKVLRESKGLRRCRKVADILYELIDLSLHIGRRAPSCDWHIYKAIWLRFIH